MSYKEVLEKIAKPNYGLQAIQEDHPEETMEYYKELSDYYASLVFLYQKLARDVLIKGQQNEE
jgi:hypothetical protein